MPRLARPDDDAEFPDDGSVSRFGKVLTITQGVDVLDVRYKRTGWRKVGYEAGDGVRDRLTDGLIFVNGERAGRITFHEYRVDVFFTGREFFNIMDEVSMETATYGELIAAGWPNLTEVAAYGDIVELHRVWMRPSLSGRGRLGMICSTMLAKLFAKRAMLTLKAFPLEYEGAVSAENTGAFERRRAAMRRHYSHMLGVSAFPGAHGEDGWMFAIPARLVGIVPRPGERALEDEDWD